MCFFFISFYSLGSLIADFYEKPKENKLWNERQAKYLIVLECQLGVYSFGWIFHKLYGMLAVLK